MGYNEPWGSSEEPFNEKSGKDCGVTLHRPEFFVMRELRKRAPARERGAGSEHEKDRAEGGEGRAGSGEKAFDARCESTST